MTVGRVVERLPRVGAQGRSVAAGGVADGAASAAGEGGDWLALH